MPDQTPVIYILYGEDEYTITQHIASMKAKLGDPSMASLNFTQLDGRSATMDELVNAVSAMPFMVDRRLVILTHPLNKLATTANKDRFLNLLNGIPDSTALVLIEYKALTSDQDKKRGRIHWLESWAKDAGKRVHLKPCLAPDDDQMITKIFGMVRDGGGQIVTPAAAELAKLVGSDTLLANQEVQKLLAYVNYDRPITVDDVKAVVEDVAPGNIFKLVDDIAEGKSKSALDLLEKMLQEQDPLDIFSMIVRQFRLLLFARDVFDSGGNADDLAREAGSRLIKGAWLARKYLEQARRFTMQDLEAIYHRLLEIDEDSKSGGMELPLAMETLITALTRPVVETR